MYSERLKYSNLTFNYMKLNFNGNRIPLPTMFSLYYNNKKGIHLNIPHRGYKDLGIQNTEY